MPSNIIENRAEKIVKVAGRAGVLLGLLASAAPVLAQVEDALQKHPAAFPQLVVTSSEKGQGIATLRSIIAALD